MAMQIAYFCLGFAFGWAIMGAIMLRIRRRETDEFTDKCRKIIHEHSAQCLEIVQAFERQRDAALLRLQEVDDEGEWWKHGKEPPI